MACPSGEELLAFHLGELTETHIVTLGQHLAACAHCEEAARQLDAMTDTAIEALRRSGPATAAYPRTPARPGPAPDIPGYEVLGLLGRGGMSVVYKARHRRLGRLVALKCLRADNPAALQRLQAEAQAVAHLSHPNIVQIFEVGEREGEPFLALEHLEGGTLADHLHGTPQDARVAAILVQTLARAVHYAHSHAIVHRDLKPANILLASGGRGPPDDSPSSDGLQPSGGSRPPLASCIPKIADFGIAKHLQTAGHTREGDIIGTACYMAPEQAGGRGAEAGPGCDIYSLGVILYELLTGHVPLQGATDLETLLLVQQADPVSPRRRQPGLPRDLDTICLKCLRKEPGARYASAHDLAEDLGRFLAGEPIHARQTGVWERGVKWARRRPAAAALLAVSAAALLCLIAGTTIHNARLGAALADAQANLEKARLAERARTHQLALAHLSDAQARRHSGLMGRRFDSLESVKKAAELLRSLGPLDAEETLMLRNEAIACLALVDMKPGKDWVLDPGWSAPLAWDAALEHYVVRDEQPHAGYVSEGRLSVRRAADRQEVACLPGFGVNVSAAEFSPDGRYLAAHYDRGERRNVVWDLSSRAIIAPLTRKARAPAAFSPDSRLAALAQPDHSIALHALPSGTKRAELPPGPPIRQVHFHPKGGWLAVVSDNTVQLHELPTERASAVADAGPLYRQPFSHPSDILSFAWRSDGKAFATGRANHDIYIWETANADTWWRNLKGHLGAVTDLRFSHAGNLLFSVRWDSTGWLWDAMTGQQQVSRLHAGLHRDFRFAPDDRRLADGCQIATGRECRTMYGAKRPRWIAISPKGRLLAALTDDGVQLWDLAATLEGDKLRATLPVPVHGALAMHFDPKGDSLITESPAGLQRWAIAPDPETAGLQIGPPRPVDPSAAPLPLAGHEPDFALGADGRTVAHSPHVGKVVLFELANPQQKRTIEQPYLRHASFSPDGRWLATGHWQGRGQGVSIWATQTGAPVCSLDVGEATNLTVLPAFSPDGKWLVTGTFAEYRFWEVGTWQKMDGLPRENAGQLQGWIVFSRDSKMLALLHDMKQVRLVDPATRREFARLPSGGGPYCFSPDGSQLVTYAGREGAFHIWDLRLIRQQLEEMDLDWDLPPLPALPQEDYHGIAEPLRVKVLLPQRGPS